MAVYRRAFQGDDPLPGEKTPDGLTPTRCPERTLSTDKPIQLSDPKALTDNSGANPLPLKSRRMLEYKLRRYRENHAHSAW